MAKVLMDVTLSLAPLGPKSEVRGLRGAVTAFVMSIKNQLKVAV